MKLSSLLNPDNIITKSKARTKEEAINEIYTLIRKNYRFDMDTELVKAAIQERENLGGTSFASGIAIPHARLDNFDDLLIGILVPENPIPDDTADLEMVVLILTSKTVSNIYLNTLAAFVKISRNKDLFSMVLRSADGDGFVEIMERENIKVKEEVNVSTIMTEDVITLSPDSTIKELVDVFYKNQIGYVPVTAQDRTFLGEINLVMLIEEGIPDYASQLGHLKFLKTFEPLERLFRKEDEIILKDIMKKPSVFFTRDTSIIEAALEFTSTRRRHIPVVEEGKVIGIVALADILNKVLRG